MYKIPSRRRKKPQEQKVNLIPILDGIFILIFFILSAAQFVKLKEIGSDLPVYRLKVENDVSQKEFGLKVIISDKELSILNEEKNELLQKFNLGDSTLLIKVTEFLVQLKAQYPDESKAKIQVKENYNYQSLIKILDAIRQSRSTEGEMQMLFNQLMFVN